ncbi:hypothetical protein [Balneola vulgaris]|uniref:hypothetical protein n=1 Tax=Balneola vulgaris TaxID=287535 RepID=UPI00036211C9|nr:hypothetical protein [Balneola vulgaris]
MTTVQSNKRLGYLFAGVAILLMIPLVAMQFTTEVVWTFSDFLIMGVLLSLVALGCEAVLRKVTGFKQRFALLFTILTVFFLIWAELAVGIFNSPFAGS